LLDRCPDPLSAFSLGAEVFVDHPERITQVPCTLAIGFDTQPTASMILAQQQLGGGLPEVRAIDAWIRIRADLGRMRLDEDEFNQILWETDAGLIQSLREIIRFYGGGHVLYWLEDTLIAVESVIIISEPSMLLRDGGGGINSLEHWEWQELATKQQQQQLYSVTPNLQTTTIPGVTSNAASQTPDVSGGGSDGHDVDSGFVDYHRPSVDVPQSYTPPVETFSMRPVTCRLDVAPLRARLERAAALGLLNRSPSPAAAATKLLPPERCLSRLNTPLLLAGIRRRCAGSCRPTTTVFH